MKAMDRSEAEKIDIQTLWFIVWKWRWLVLMFMAVVMGGSVMQTFTATPIYTAKGTLLIEKEPNILTFEEILQIESNKDDYAQTQFKLLKSYSLAEKTVEKLGLAEKAARQAKAGQKEKNNKAVDAQDPELKNGLAEALMEGIIVRPIRLTRLVDVSYGDPDPKMAAATVNALFETFIDMSIEAKYTATAQASEFLTNQIVKYRSDVEISQQKLQSYGAAKDIIALSDTETTTIEKLGGLNRALTEATIERIKKETYYNEIKIATGEYIPETMTNPLLQRLRESYVGLSRDYQKKSGTYGPEYPEMQRLKSELETTRQALDSETQNLIKGVYSDFQSVLKREQSLTRVFNAQKIEAERLNSNAIAYYSLKNDIDNKNNLLDMLMKRESEAGISSRMRGLRTSNIRIVDKARVPAAPSSPNKKRNLLLALFLGLCGGLGIAFFFEYFDNSVKTCQDVEKLTGLPTLGIIREFSVNGFNKSYGYSYGFGQVASRKKKKMVSAGPQRHLMSEGVAAGAEKEKGDKEVQSVPQIELITHYAPTAQFTESYLSFRTGFLLSSSAPTCKTVVFSSCLPGEGKSTSSSNFAVTLTQNNKRVLLLDAELRKPRQHRIFGVKNLQGLTNYLTCGIEIKDLIKRTKVNNLCLITAGPVSPNPVDLLGSAKMATLLERLKQYFDYIVIDAPPVLAVSDAQIVARYTDGVILVIWSGKTPREALRLAKEKFVLTNIKILGVLINHVNSQNHGYYNKQYGNQAYRAGEGEWT